MPPETDKKPETDTKTDADNTGDPPAKYMTAEDFNKAISARDKRFAERFEKTLEEKLSKLFAAKTKSADDEDEEPSEAKPATSTGSAAPGDDRIRKLEKQLAREKAEREKEKAERDQERAKVLRDEERGKLAEALAGAGVTGVKAKAAIALLHTEGGRVRRSGADASKIVFLDDEGEEQDFAPGFKAWLATDDGKSFAPPRGAQGAGTPPQPRSSPKPAQGQNLSVRDRIYQGLTGQSR